MHPSYHVIIADDDDTVRSLVARLIVRLYANISITAVSDGVDALMIYGQRGSDMLITNFDMPMMNGIVLTQVLRSRQATMPIVMLSADDSIEQQALMAGVTHFLLKPFGIQQFDQIVSSVLTR